ncbi:hypothetical protein VNO77_04846 [Canavalia gladiata]|uniref:Uncharacterized protein n=1 Tax=Canavalia gladiata TaxID=3824 RepID=A0AAN9MX82_CANGL
MASEVARLSRFGPIDKCLMDSQISKCSRCRLRYFGSLCKWNKESHSYVLLRYAKYLMVYIRFARSLPLALAFLIYKWKRRDQFVCDMVEDFLQNHKRTKRALVYEYMLNGTLDKHILSQEEGNVSISYEKSIILLLDWLMELNIACKRNNELLYKNIGGISYKADTHFAKWVYDQYEETIDLSNATEEEKVIEKMIMITSCCIQMKPNDHASMKQVMKMHEGEYEFQDDQIPVEPLCLFS